MNIKFSTEFKRILNLSNYVIGGFSYIFTADLAKKDPNDPTRGIDIEDDGTLSQIDEVDINYIKTKSSIFNCSSVELDNGLNISVSTDRDKDNNGNYKYIILLYVDMMKDDILLNKTNSLNNYLRLGAIINNINKDESPEYLRKDPEEDIPNMMHICNSIKCSILSKSFDDKDIYHLKTPQVTRSEYTNPSIRLKSTLLSYKPTEDLLMDDIISREQNPDSFMINKSGLIKI